ncbi:acetyl-CoA synthetase-like protein [Thozetella sp. PMI_491]|nr:acetyl-CoA synthetase-like protein [Thozetella sp. PMI_491]
MSTQTCLQEVLRDRAEVAAPGRLLLYRSGNTTEPREISYTSLYEQARDASRVIQALEAFEAGRPVLLHLDDHWDTILWFWGVLLADGLPVLSSPFSNAEDHRLQHIRGLSKLLESPICITRTASLHLFGDDHGMQLHPIELLVADAKPETAQETDKDSGYDTGSDAENADLAMLMLTSGSTGNAKAVQLTHEQVLAAVSGKASVRKLPQDRPFLNWIGLDHPASLVEIHIQALWLGVDQVSVCAADVVSSPSIFLDLLSRHRVSRSFAPNFFLAKLVSKVESNLLDDSELVPSWDLSSLTVLASGGEANDVDTCVAASSILAKYGAPSNVITTGFGMTETCAGAIFNLDCPNYDVTSGRSVASLGICMPGIEMRITTESLETGAPTLATPGEFGDLEVRGPVVFGGYYRDPVSTAAALSSDGWFRTGDRGTIDTNGNLSLTGRVKDVININGVKMATADIQTSLERALGDRVASLITFPSRAAHTEQVTVACFPREWPVSARDLLEIEDLAVQECIVRTSSRPLVFFLQKTSQSLVPTSTLGKISRAKMRTLFEEGAFAQDVNAHTLEVRHARATIMSAAPGLPATEEEADLIRDFSNLIGVHSDAISVDTPVFELGFTSMHLIKLKNRVDTRLGIRVPIIVFMKNPTARSLATALSKLQITGPTTGLPEQRAQTEPLAEEYDPVVVLRSDGHRTPLWLVHPGVGEVLVFVGLAQHMHSDDRPLYALRARGFEAGVASGSDQAGFASINEAVETYVGAVRQRQPRGPYALAGYSYGTMLAFEMAKCLDTLEPGSVRFLGSFNLPPHIKTRMRQLSWNMCLLHLTYFLGLHGSEDPGEAGAQQDFGTMARGAALAQVLEIADPGRMHELGVDGPALARWADVAYGLQSMAVDYEPTGQVEAIDVFHAQPLQVAAASREEWLRDHLGRWEDFSRSRPRFHAVGGAHYTMIGPDHVVGFTQALRAALGARGL